MEQQLEILAGINFNGAFISNNALARNNIIPIYHPFVFDDVAILDNGRHFYKDFALVMRNGNCGAINTLGEEIIPCIYSFINGPCDGIFTVQNKKGLTGYRDIKGKVIIQPKYYDAGDFSEGLAVIEDVDTRLCGYIDKLGREVIKPEYGSAKAFASGMAAIMDVTTSKWGYINSKGVIVIACQYDEAASFYDGIASVGIRNEKTHAIKYKYINKKNEDHLSHLGEESDLKKTSEETFLISEKSPVFRQPYIIKYKDENQKCGYLDEKNEIVIPAQFDWVGKFSCNVAPVMNYFMVNSERATDYQTEIYRDVNKYAIIDAWGNLLTNGFYQYSKKLDKTLIYTHFYYKKGKYILIAPKKAYGIRITKKDEPTKEIWFTSYDDYIDHFDVLVEEGQIVDDMIEEEQSYVKTINLT